MYFNIMTLGYNKPTPDETAEWWKWLLEIAKPNNPLITGNIAQKQDRPFLCMACTGPFKSVEDHGRSHKMSAEDAKKPIMIPVFVAERSEAESNANSDQLLNGAREDVANITELELGVDKDLSLTTQELQQFYVESSDFHVDLPDNNVLEVPKRRQSKTASAGIWVKLEPLASGKHVVRFGGTGGSGAAGGTGEFHTKVTYSIEVP
jgi:hypothetical protein